MSLREQLNEDLRQALRSGDEIRKTTLRGLLAAVRTAEDTAVKAQLDRQGVTEGTDIARITVEFGDAEVIQVIRRAREAIASEARAVIAEVGAAGPADKGKVMPVLIKRLAGQADGREINAVVTELLAGPR
jgi:uncharacterized protein YqeY